MKKIWFVIGIFGLSSLFLLRPASARRLKDSNLYLVYNYLVNQREEIVNNQGRLRVSSLSNETGLSPEEALQALIELSQQKIAGKEKENLLSQLFSEMKRNREFLNIIQQDERGLPLFSQDEILYQPDLIQLYEYVHTSGTWHSNAQVIFIDRKGNVLLQHKVLSRTGKRVKMISTGGHLLAGEDSVTGLRREIREELSRSESGQGFDILQYPFRLSKIGNFLKIGGSNLQGIDLEKMGLPREAYEVNGDGSYRIKRDFYQRELGIFFGPMHHKDNREVTILYIFLLDSMQEREGGKVVFELGGEKFTLQANVRATLLKIENLEKIRADFENSSQKEEEYFSTTRNILILEEVWQEIEAIAKEAGE